MALGRSYFFYGWWNPYYLLLVIYSTTLDFCLVTLMDHCPRRASRGVLGRLTRLRFDDRGAEATPSSVSALAPGYCWLACPGRRRCGPRWPAWARLCCSWPWGPFYGSRRIWL